MNIIACSYTNLGPFANRTISLVVHPGSAMVIAPVGTGKSMLFFDGIVYGLYKYSTRDIINNSCSTGSVSMLIELHGEYWLIRRDLKATKTRSISTTSMLSRWHGDIDSIYSEYNQILYADRDIISELDPQYTDTIVFKNESDLQKNLEEFLPARDVFMNRDMMMQESSNIFDLTQTQRIDVFKHLFELLDIDAAKDRLGEEKTKLKYLLQAKQDTSTLTDKFTLSIDTLTQLWSKLTANDIINIADYDNKQIQSWLDSSSVVDTTVSIDTVSMIQRDHGDDIRTQLDIHKQTYHQSQAHAQQLQTTLSDLQTKRTTVQSQHTTLTSQITQTQSVIQTYNIEQLQSLKSDKLSIIQQTNELEFAIDYDAFDAEVEDLTQAYQYVTKITEQGKQLGLRKITIDNQIISLQNTQQLEARNLQSQTHTLETQIQQLTDQITLKQEKLDIASKFYCIKIEADCPFVSQINESVLTAHARELEQITTQRDQIIARKNALAQVPHGTDYEQHITGNKIQQDDIANEIATLKSTLSRVGYKQINESYPIFQQLQSKLKTIDNQINDYEAKLKTIDELTTQLQTYRIQSQETTTQIETMDRQISHTIDMINTHKADNATVFAQYAHITSYETLLQQVVNTIQRINDLISDYKTSQQAIIALQIKSKRIDELYTIVSKELTVLVLQEYLPILSDIINNQLAKVVDYRLEFSVNTAGDKLEILIVDEFGSREVKTLSGGQRAILRLCWILAIALWSGNKFLFLDETINHLDKEMISQAAELIEEFVQGNQVTLYAITHSEQIQMLDIWDHVVRVKEVININHQL